MIEIRINVPEGIYLDYLAYLFEKDPETGSYHVSSVSDFGKLLIAYAKVSDAPLRGGEPQERMKSVNLLLPLCDTSQDLQNKWLYYSAPDTARLLAVLRSEFNRDFISYYLRGTVMGHKKKEIIEMFIISRKLISVDPYEALHKRIYRLEQAKMAEYSKRLKRKANYFEEHLNIEGLI